MCDKLSRGQCNGYFLELLWPLRRLSGKMLRYFCWSLVIDARSARIDRPVSQHQLTFMHLCLGNFVTAILSVGSYLATSARQLPCRNVWSCVVSH